MSPHVQTFLFYVETSDLVQAYLPVSVSCSYDAVQGSEGNLNLSQ